MKKIMLGLSLLLGCWSAADACDVGYHLVCRSGGGRGAHYVCGCVANYVAPPPPPTCTTSGGIVLNAGTTILLFPAATAPDDLGCVGEYASCDGTGALTQDTANIYKTCSADAATDGGL